MLILRLEGWDSEGEACWELEGEGWECRPMTGVLGMEGGPQAGTAGTLSSSLDWICFTNALLAFTVECQNYWYDASQTKISKSNNTPLVYITVTHGGQG